MKRVGLKLLVLGVYLLVASLTLAAEKIHFPDIMGYETLKCDFHMHTVFSDGMVWPTVRVDEAVREGLDAIAITDHIEYQPKKADIPTNLNRSYEIAKGPAAKAGLLLVKAAEITRSTPPGHFNALFLNDVRPLDVNDFLDAVKAANDQHAFVFWNHPDWQKDHIGWFEIHDILYKNHMFAGIEVANGDGYHLNGHKWDLEKNLTMMGNSDIHAPSLITKTTPDNHRTMTLVFAKDKSIDAVKEALFAGRTTVWFEHQLIGREKYLSAIFNAAVKAEAKGQGRRKVITLTNNCDLPMKLTRTGELGPEQVELPAMDTAAIRVRLENGVNSCELQYTVENMLTAPNKGLPVTIKVSTE